MFSLIDTILLRGVRSSGMVDNATISTEGTKRGLEKLKCIIDTKNFRLSGTLSDNLWDEVGDHRDNLRVVVEKVDPTYASVVIKKHSIIAMTQNIGGTRRTLNIIMKEIKRCRRGDAIAIRVRRLMMFAQLT